MGYFDQFVENSLFTDAEGRVLFYPYGSFGRGYIIGAPAKQEQLRKLLLRYHTVSISVVLPVVLIGQMVIGFPATLLPALGWTALAYAWYYLSVQPLLRGEVPTAPKLGWGTMMARQAQRYSTARLWTGVLISVSFLLLGLIFLLTDSTRLLGLCEVVVFGPMTLVWVYMMRSKQAL
jgi:hypothetical protein